MLIDTPYKNNDTITIKLVTGEEVVARLDEEKDNEVIVSKPFQLVADQKGVGLSPFVFTANREDKFKLNKGNIICIVKTEKQMASQYVETTTGLKLA